MDFEKKLSELFVELPEVMEPNGAVVPVVMAGKLCYVGHHYPFTEGRLVFKGRLGFEVTVDQGGLAAKHAVIQALAALRQALGSLNKIRQVVQLTVVVAASPDFKDHDKVADGASQFLHEIFGSAGRHARLISAAPSLPQGACLSLSLVVEIK